MAFIGAKITEMFQVILAVLGIIGAYPDVTVDSIFVYKNFSDPAVVNAQFRACNLINGSVREIIEGGIDVNIIYRIKTVSGKAILYESSVANRVSYKNGTYSVNHRGSYNFNLLTNTICANELIVLTNSNAQKNKLIQTDIEILINCDATPEVINLWGNKPKITMTYNLGE